MVSVCALILLLVGSMLSTAYAIHMTWRHTEEDGQLDQSPPTIYSSQSSQETLKQTTTISSLYGES